MLFEIVARHNLLKYIWMCASSDVIFDSEIQSLVHLGHLAKSFALREAPAEVITVAKRQRMKDEERKMRKGLKVDRIRGEEGGREKLIKKARFLERKAMMDEFS